MLLGDISMYHESVENELIKLIDSYSTLNLMLGEYLFDELQKALSSLLSKVFGLDIKGFL